MQANLPQYAALPVLSVSAPFKSGFGGGDYTDVASGNVAITKRPMCCITGQSIQEPAQGASWMEKYACAACRRAQRMRRTPIQNRSPLTGAEDAAERSAGFVASRGSGRAAMASAGYSDRKLRASSGLRQDSQAS